MPLGLSQGVRGLGTRGHASVTQARDTLNLGVVTYYHPLLYQYGIKTLGLFALWQGQRAPINGSGANAKRCS